MVEECQRRGMAIRRRFFHACKCRIEVVEVRAGGAY